MFTCFFSFLITGPIFSSIFESNNWDGSPEHRRRWKNAYSFNT